MSIRNSGKKNLPKNLVDNSFLNLCRIEIQVKKISEKLPEFLNDNLFSDINSGRNIEYESNVYFIADMNFNSFLECESDDEDDEDLDAELDSAENDDDTVFVRKRTWKK